MMETMPFQNISKQLERENSLPKILVVDTQSPNPLELIYPTDEFQNHKQYWNLYLNNHPEINIPLNQNRNQTAFEIAVQKKIVFLDITNYQGKKTPPQSGILFLPHGMSEKDFEYLFLLKYIFKSLGFLEVAYDIEKRKDGWHHKSISQLSTQEGLAINAIDVVYGKLQKKETYYQKKIS